MKAIHRLRVLHCDAAWHNILLDASQNIMVIDFERAKLPKQQPLRQISMNLLGRKRRYPDKMHEDEFTRELQAAIGSVEGRFGNYQEVAGVRIIQAPEPAVVCS